MLLIYRTDTGDVVDDTGTNSAAPLGPPDELAYRNTDARGVDRSLIALLRLHDVDDADAVQLALTRSVRVVDGQLVDDGPLPDPVPVEPPPPSLADRLEAVEAELRGMRERAAAVAVTGGAAAVRDAITGKPAGT